jgi:hypothetical protein
MKKMPWYSRIGRAKASHEDGEIGWVRDPIASRYIASSSE